MKENTDLITRSIPGYEGFYSIRSDGAVFSDARVVEASDGRVLRFKKKMLKVTFVKNKHGNIEKSPNYKFSVEGKRTSFSTSALMKMVFPELFKPVDNLDGEEWRSIADHPKYMVSSMGRFKRVREVRWVGGINYVNEEELRHLSLIDGYPSVGLCSGNNQNRRLAARIVYEVFVGKITEESHIHYKDGNRLNICASNLMIKCREDYRQRDGIGRYQ